MKKTGLYVQYGCGLSAPERWLNYDVSPTLRIQKIPILGKLLRNRLNANFPANVLYGDILSTFPVADNSCKGVYCSHTLEHLSLKDCRIALKKSYDLLEEGGIFRCVLPDLEHYARTYIESIDNQTHEGSIQFMKDTMLGQRQRRRGLKQFISSFYGNSSHLWMWDHKSLAHEMEQMGFKDVRVCQFNDCEDEHFKDVEELGRFEKAVALEGKK